MLCPSFRCGVSGLLLVVAGLAACPGELIVPDDAQLNCADDAQCPADLVCNVAAGRCVPPGTVLDLTAPLVVSVGAASDRLGPGSTTTVTVVASEVLKAATVTDELGATLVATVSANAVAITVEADARAASGAVGLRITWADPAGNAASVVVDSGVTVDVDPPALQNDTVVVVANANTNVLSPASPSAARADSDVTATMAFDERLDAVVAVRLVSADDVAGEGFVVAADAVIDRVQTGVRVAVAAAALAAIAEIEDGAWFFALDVVDELGNAGRVVGATPLVIDTTPPPPPSLTLVRRAPFGDGARATAQTSLTGIADDAVLVIAVPGAVALDDGGAPPFVGRREPDAAGAFSLAVPLDIEAIRVIAVDAAGNLSAPAAPATLELVASVLATSTPHRILGRRLSREQLVQQSDQPVNDALRAGSVTTTSAPSWTPLTTVVHDRIPENPVMSWDPVNGATLMMAGGETLLLRGSQVRRLDVPRLPVRKGYGIATDERRGRIVLFGGDDADGNARNSLYEWDGERWHEVLAHDPLATDRPSPRVGHGVAFVPGLGGTAVVNGCARDVEIGIFGCQQGLPPDVWLWDGAVFTRLCEGAACEATALLPNRPELAVDHDGRLVAHGGFGNAGPVAVPFPRPPAVATFDGTRWVGRCAEACAEALPPNPSMFHDHETESLAFFGICPVEGPCVVSVHDDDSVETVALGELGFPLFTGLAFQERSVAIEPDGRLVIAQRGADGNDKGFVAALDHGRPGIVVPSTMQARCGGAIVARPGEHLIVGGCANCRLGAADAAENACLDPIALAEAPGAPGGNRGETLAEGLVRAVEVGTASGTDVRLLRAGRNPATGNGAVTVQAAAALDVPPILVDLGAPATPDVADDRLAVEGAFPLSDGRIALREVIDDGFGFMSSTGTLRALDASLVLREACGADCGLDGAAFGFGVAGHPDVGGLFFGGDTNGGVSAQTVRIAADGVPISVTSAQSPPPRRHADLTWDATRDAAWLFGGMSQPEIRFSNDIFDCGVPGGTPQCGDLWRYTDVDGWQPIQPVDVDGFGRPQQRYRAALGAFDGDVIVAGGRGPDFGLFGIDHTLDDAWRLAASPRQVPSHLVEVALTPFGADVAGRFTAVKVDWCGEARDASGELVGVEARLWLGGAWRARALSPSPGGCATGTIDLIDDADLVDRGGRLFAEVRPVALVDGPGDASLTTTSLTVTTSLSP